MAGPDLHKAQAEHNILLLERLDETGIAGSHPDWVITVSFYASVHLVEAVLGCAKFLYVVCPPRKKVRVEGPIHSDVPPPLIENRNISPHRLREKLIDWNPLLFPGCLDPYKDLLEMSFASRYTCQSVGGTIAQDARDCLDQIRKMLEPQYVKLMAVRPIPSESP